MSSTRMKNKVHTCNRVSCGMQFTCRMKKKRHQDKCTHAVTVTQREFLVDPVSKAYTCLKCSRVFSKHTNYYRHKKDCCKPKKQKKEHE